MAMAAPTGSAAPVAPALCGHLALLLLLAAPAAHGYSFPQQHTDGSFAYCGNPKPNLSLSTHPRETLLKCVLRGCHLRYELLRNSSE